MLVIRMQRTGRKGHAQFRVVVQDSRRTPTSGKIVAALGHFNPHTKETSLDKEKAVHYLTHGAQPSERAIRLLQAEGVKLPSWVKLPTKRSGEVRNVEKRRSTRPADAEASQSADGAEQAQPNTPDETDSAEAPAEKPAEPAEAPEEKVAEPTETTPEPAEEKSAESKPAEEPKA